MAVRVSTRMIASTRSERYRRRGEAVGLSW